MRIDPVKDNTAASAENTLILASPEAQTRTLPPPEQAALAYAWGKYRVYANTSRRRKAELTAWRLRVLVFVIVGAVLGIASQQLPSVLRSFTFFGLKISELLGFLTAAFAGLAAFFGRELVNPDQERQWIRARSTAEALKTEIYLYLTGTRPYNVSTKADLLLRKVGDLQEKVGDLPVEEVSDAEKKKGLPTKYLNVDQYIESRLNNQINNFYRFRVCELTQKMRRSRNVVLALGAAAVVLGVLERRYLGTAAWVAVISTVTASITAYTYAGRYQYLVVSYEATADRLERLRTRWQVAEKTDTDETRSDFIEDCEEAISIENSAWMADVIKEKKTAGKRSDTANSR